MDTAEALKKCREMSPGIAEWIDAQLAEGKSPAHILMHLKAAVDLAQFERANAGLREFNLAKAES